MRVLPLDELFQSLPTDQVDLAQDCPSRAAQVRSGKDWFDRADTRSTNAMLIGDSAPISASPSPADGGSVTLRKLVTGQVLMREGDPPGAIYVICAGRLRVYRREAPRVPAA